MNTEKIQSLNKRDDSIDILRWLSLTGIILVHIQPSLFWSQIRSFDVPMMVFLSAYCFAQNPQSKINDYKAYCIKRFKRLVLPCWIFLITWFLFYHGFLGHSIDWLHIGLCFSLLTPWYLWVIRIFMLMALIAPLTTKLLDTISAKQFFLIMIIGLTLNEILCNISKSYAYIVVIMTFSYFLIFIYGAYIHKLSHKQISIIGIISMLLFVSFALALFYNHGSFISTGKYKYPPSIYYLSYAIACISFLWKIRLYIVIILQRLNLLKIATYIGSHTLWIYFWHIPIVTHIDNHYNATIRFCIVYSIATIITYIQVSIVKRICVHIHNTHLRKDIISIFIG